MVLGDGLEAKNQSCGLIFNDRRSFVIEREAKAPRSEYYKTSDRSELAKDIELMSQTNFSSVPSMLGYKNNKTLEETRVLLMVLGDGIEPPTRGFSVLCSTN